MARGRRVVAPDGRVWYVRRRRSRRSWRWSRAAGATARFAAEEELTDDDEEVVPPLEALFTNSGDDIGEPGFDRTYDDREALRYLTFALALGALVALLLAMATVVYVLPWLVPFVTANAVPILAAAAVAAVLVTIARLRRPWFVELQRQGLSDAPRRVWRVRGWRRSGRMVDEIAAAVREGRVDSAHAAVLLPGPPRRQPPKGWSAILTGRLRRRSP